MMRAAFRTCVAGVVLLVGALLVDGCAIPVTVERVGHGTVHQQITHNVLSANALSDETHNVLRRWSLADRRSGSPDRTVTHFPS